MCRTGFYCKPGTAIPTTPCPRGSFCPEGSRMPSPCEAGTYQNGTGATSCRECPAGSYCLWTSATEVDPKPCPRGYYCPAGTSISTQFACPNGTYSNRTGLFSRSQCEPWAASPHAATGNEFQLSAASHLLYGERHTSWRVGEAGASASEIRRVAELQDEGEERRVAVQRQAVGGTRGIQYDT